MKTKFSILITTAFFLLCMCANAQVIDPKKEVEKEGTKRVNKNVDKSIDKGFDKIEEGIGSLFGKKKKKKKADKQTETNAQQNEQQPVTEESAENEDKATLDWAKYDFIPGDHIIFEDNLENEENGEFPSRWDLQYGNVEIAKFGGENVIMFMSGSSCIIPFLKNPIQDYLPDIFTIEFDAYYDVEPHSAKYYVSLFDKKNQKSSGKALQKIQLFPGGIQFENSSNLVEGGDGLWYNQKKPFWRHISIGFNIRALKVYYDDVRMLNIPNLGFNPSGVSIEIINTDPVNFYIKNIRIASGGQKLYDKYLQDGKIVANGIRFEVNEAKLLPESMGVINEMVELMKEHPEINFIVEGHTDSDGDDTSNQNLSEQRAATVVTTLTKMGIASNRMTSKGWGESKPMDTNDTPEGKANNRRVEFVKM